MTKNKGKTGFLKERQIIEMLISPRAALDRLIALGTIDYNDLGSIQCVYVLAAQMDNVSGIESPDSSIIYQLVQQIEAGIPVLEERIQKSQEWLNRYADYLRRVPLKDVQKAIAITQKMVHE
jgi:hypothetical protein